MGKDVVRFFEKGVEILQQIGNLRWGTIISDNMGNCFMWQENREEAKSYLSKAIELAERMKWVAYEKDLLSDLFFCNIMLGNDAECKSLVNEVGNNIKGRIFKMIYREKMLNKDISIELEKLIDEKRKEDWLLSNNEIILSLFYYILDDNIKKNENIRLFLLENSFKILKNRKKELFAFPTYNKSFSIKKIEKIIEYLKEE